MCLTLNHRIHFPEPVSMPAHPSISELAVTVFDLNRKLADSNTNYTNLHDRVFALQGKLTEFIANSECVHVIGPLCYSYCRFGRAQ